MSWCRWGSKCGNTIMPKELYAPNLNCPDATCPGSSIYVYDDICEGLVCCWCQLMPDVKDFVAGEDVKAMHRHLLDHDAAGHHVRKSLIAHAKDELGMGGPDNPFTVWRLQVEAEEREEKA